MKFETFLVAVLAISIGIPLGWKLKPGPEPGMNSESPDPGPPVEFALPVESPPPVVVADEIGSVLFDRHHDAAVAKFESMLGFGMRRIIVLPNEEEKKNSPFNQFDFTLIGNDPDMRKDDTLQAGNGPPVPVAFRIMHGVLKVDHSLAEGDRRALDLLAGDGSARRAFHQTDDSVFAYGPVRAREKCAKCHGVEEGALLGMFRYRFERPGDLEKVDLAAILDQITSYPKR